MSPSSRLEPNERISDPISAQLFSTDAPLSACSEASIHRFSSPRYSPAI